MHHHGNSISIHFCGTTTSSGGRQCADYRSGLQLRVTRRCCHCHGAQQYPRRCQRLRGLIVICDSPLGCHTYGGILSPLLPHGHPRGTGRELHPSCHPSRDWMARILPRTDLRWRLSNEPQGVCQGFHSPAADARHGYRLQYHQLGHQRIPDRQRLRHSHHPGRIRRTIGQLGGSINDDHPGTGSLSAGCHDLHQDHRPQRFYRLDLRTLRFQLFHIGKHSGIDHHHSKFDRPLLDHARELGPDPLSALHAGWKQRALCVDGHQYRDRNQ